MATVPQAWADYQEASFAILPASLAEEAEGAELPDEATVDVALERSDALEAAIEEHLGADRDDVRDLAALQLQAAATADLGNAQQLLDLEEAGGVRAALASDVWDDIQRILQTPTEDGIMAVIGPDSDGGYQASASTGNGAPADVPATKLKAAVDAAVDKVTEDAGAASATTVKALVGIPGGELARALQKGLEEHLKAVADAVNWVKRKVLGFLVRAVRKLLAIFGSKTEELRQRLGDWVDDFDGDKMKSVLSVIYRVDALKQRYADRVDGAGPSLTPERETAAETRLSELQRRWHKRTWLIDNAGGLLASVAGKIRDFAPPYSQAAYLAVFLAATGYVIFGGGDYLDWSEGKGILNLVDGVGSVVDEAVATPTGA